MCFEMTCVEIKIYGAFVLNQRVVLHAIDATPARWRGDAGSSPLDRARTAASSLRNDLVKNCRVHPTHWFISTQVEWKDLHMTQEEQDRIAYLRERGAKHVFTPYELEVRALRSRDLEAYKKPTPLTAQFDRECRYDYKEEGLSFDPRVSTKQSFCSKVFDWCCCCCICCCCLCGNQPVCRVHR